jgi:hypothetical protein
MSHKPEGVKIFDVLRHAVSGELHVVMSVAGDRLETRDKTGAVARYKLDKHFSFVAHDEAVEFRALSRAAAKKLAEKKPRRRRTVAAFLSRLAKKRGSSR